MRVYMLFGEGEDRDSGSGRVPVPVPVLVLLRGGGPGEGVLGLPHQPRQILPSRRDDGRQRDARGGLAREGQEQDRDGENEDDVNHPRAPTARSRRHGELTERGPEVPL